MDVISTARLEGSMGTCPYCDARPITSFNLKYAHWYREPELGAIRSHWADAARLKWGSLRRCTECGQGWYVGGDETMATRISREREPLLARWSDRRLSIGDEHLTVLASIGAIEGDRYGNGRGYLHIPCAIDWADGSTSDPCVLLVTALPPIAASQQQVRLFEDVQRVRATDYALPLDVRCATRRAEEQSMGYTPTWVEDAAGHTFVLNWSADVLDHDGVRGKDIRLTAKPSSWTAKDMPPIVEQSGDTITWVYADWTDDTKRLVAQCPERYRY